MLAAVYDVVELINALIFLSPSSRNALKSVI